MNSLVPDEEKSKEQLIWELNQLRQRLAALEEADVQRRKIEKSLTQYEQNFKELVRLLPQTVYEMTIDGKFQFINDYGFAAFGYTPEEIEKGIHFSQLFIPEDRERIQNNIKKILSGSEIEGHEYTALRKDGTTFPVLIYSSPIINNGKAVGLRGVVIDITDRKKIEQELRDSRDQFRNLSAHLQSVREEERSYIAREIHDELGQALTALKMDLMWINRKINPNEKEIIAKIYEMYGLIDQTIQVIRRISTDLRPGLLDDLGLFATIEWYCEDFENRTGIKCELELSPKELTLDQERSIAIFRILQEALTNVARHAKANLVKVIINCNSHFFRMEIIDNGIGITDEQIKDPKNLGLVGLRERVYPFNGTITFEGKPGKGTSVKVIIPL